VVRAAARARRFASAICGEYEGNGLVDAQHQMILQAQGMGM